MHILIYQYLLIMGPINGSRWFRTVTYHASEIHRAVLVYEHFWFPNDRRYRLCKIKKKKKHINENVSMNNNQYFFLKMKRNKMEKKSIYIHHVVLYYNQIHVIMKVSSRVKNYLKRILI